MSFHLAKCIDITPNGVLRPGFPQDYREYRKQAWFPRLLATASHIRFWADWPSLQPNKSIAFGDPANPDHFKLTGLTPYLTKGEALLAAKAFRATGRRELPQKADGSCPLLHPQTGRCLIYADRPFGCRTHFCASAGGPYARRDVLDLIRRLEAVDAALGGAGAAVALLSELN